MGLSLWDGVQGADRTLQLQVCPSWLQKTRPVQTGQWLWCLPLFKKIHSWTCRLLHSASQHGGWRCWYTNSPVGRYLSSHRGFSDIQNRLFMLFFFSSFQYKGPKKQVISYSIAVKNACFYWLIECIAPSMHALTARLGPLTWVV